MKQKINYEKYNFDGVLYPVSGRKDKVMITVSGSEGGLGHAEKMAAWFQSVGIPALAVGYFGTKHTPKYLEKVPLEYVTCAVSLLKEQGYEAIGIQGLSKGAEYAALAAADIPEITCVVLKTPSWYVSEGLRNNQPSGCSCWSRNGEEIPFTPYKIRKFQLLKYMKETGEFNLLKINCGKDVTSASVLPVEKINGPVLLFSTEADNVWPSSESSKEIMERLEKEKFAFPYRSINYKYMCHIMLENANSMTRLISKSEKKYPEQCASERKNMAEETRNWVENVWGSKK